MEISGVVVAASEKISLEHCVGLLLMLYIADLEKHFCILVCENVTSLWKKIRVNECWKFSGLKVGMLQTSSGGKVLLLKTTETSAFSHMPDLRIGKNLESLILVPESDRLVTVSSPLESNLVSYQGSVTRLRNFETGMYELDSKVVLCTAFNPGCVKLSEGSEVVVSNAHLIKDYLGAPILVCCGSSCVKNSRAGDINEKSHPAPNDGPFVNLCLPYGLNVFDLLWFEGLSSRLQKKLTPLITDAEILFQQDSGFLKQTLEYFLCFENETTNKKFSLVEEFLSCPHRCFPFLKSALPTACRVPDLSAVAAEDAWWTDATPRWKFSVGTRVNSVIIGILYVSTDGNFYVADGTLELPILLAEDCDRCCHDVLKELKNLDCASVVAIQEYDVVVENISCKNGTEQSIRYIRSSFCRLCSLFSLRKSTRSDSSQKFCCALERGEENGENRSDSEAENRRFLVLSKIWTLGSKVPHCSGALVTLVSENSQSVGDFSGEGALEDTFEFGDSRDDEEFADLISKLDSLHMEDNKGKRGYLCFEDTSQDNVVFPGHVYYVYPKDSSEHFNWSCDGKDHGMFTWLFTPGMKIVHDPACTGRHAIEDCEGAELHGIKEIISRRHLNPNWIVTCVLQDKTYEDVENATEDRMEPPLLPGFRRAVATAGAPSTPLCAASASW